MKAIILAAWEGTRLKPLTNTTPKPLIKIVWKTIIEHNLEHIYKYVSEIIIIVKYKSELIKKTIWKKYKWVKVTYKEQGDKKWTWAALEWLNLDKNVLIINWDSIFDKKDLKKIIELKWFGALVKKVENPERYWIFKTWKKDNIECIIEKPKIHVWNLANLWVYKFSSEIFKYIEEIKPSSRWEYEITDAINMYVKENNLKAITIKWEFIDIWYPWDILSANKYFLDKLTKSNIKWTIEDWVTIKWNIILEKWAILKSWTYIEWNIYIWKNSKIWPNTYLRWSSVIWNWCRVWNAVEIKNSSIWDNTNLAHLIYMWDSILGNNINIWWWLITANLRHDKWDIKALNKWELINTWLKKLWCIIWDNTKTWINTSTYPWRIIENDCFTVPGEIVK